MNVRVDEPEVSYSGTYSFIQSDNNNGFDITEDSLRLSNIKIRVDKSTDSNYHVSIWRYSAGKNRVDAARRAERISYSASTLDSALVLGSGYGISKEQKFRGQKVIVDIKVPVGKKIRFDQSVEDKLNNTNIRIRERRNWGNRDWDMDWNDDSYYDWKANEDYVMTEDGSLVSVLDNSKPSNRNNDVYEYRRDSTNNINERQGDTNQRQLEQQIEDQRRVIDEEKKRLQDLQRKKENSGTTMVKTKKTGYNFSDNTAQISSPIFSLLVL